jgi:hypothetical protein
MGMGDEWTMNAMRKKAKEGERERKRETRCNKNEMDEHWTVMSALPPSSS